MEYILKSTIENLKIQHARLDSEIKEEEAHVWKNLVRIEQLKKEKLRKKDEVLRYCLHSRI